MTTQSKCHQVSSLSLIVKSRCEVLFPSAVSTRYFLMYLVAAMGGPVAVALLSGRVLCRFFLRNLLCGFFRRNLLCGFFLCGRVFRLQNLLNLVALSTLLGVSGVLLLLRNSPELSNPLSIPVRIRKSELTPIIAHIGEKSNDIVRAQLQFGSWNYLHG